MTNTMLIQETEKDICLIAGYLIAQGRIEIDDSRDFINERVPEMAKKFESLKGTAWDPEDYLTGIDEWAEEHLVNEFAPENEAELAWALWTKDFGEEDPPETEVVIEYYRKERRCNA